MVKRSDLAGATARSHVSSARTSMLIGAACPFCLHEMGLLEVQAILPLPCDWHRREIAGEAHEGLTLGALLIDALDGVRAEREERG